MGQRQLRDGAAGRGAGRRAHLDDRAVLLGGGKRIFPDDGMARPLELVKCVTTGTGVQLCTYRPAS